MSSDPRLIQEDSDDAAALTPEDRQVRESELMADLLEQEMIVGALTWKAIEAQLPVWFGDLDPKAILQIRLVTLAQSKPGTSPGLAHDIFWPGG